MRWNRFVRIDVETESEKRENATETETKIEVEIENETETNFKVFTDQKYIVECKLRYTKKYEREFPVVLHNRKSGIVNPANERRVRTSFQNFYEWHKTDSKLVWRLWSGNYLSCSAAIANNVRREGERRYVLWEYQTWSHSLKLIDIFEQLKWGIDMQLKINAHEQRKNIDFYILIMHYIYTLYLYIIFL